MALLVPEMSRSLILHVANKETPSAPPNTRPMGDHGWSSGLARAVGALVDRTKGLGVHYEMWQLATLGLHTECSCPIVAARNGERWNFSGRQRSPSGSSTILRVPERLCDVVSPSSSPKHALTDGNWWKLCLRTYA